MKIAAAAGLCISAAVICRIFDKTGREYGVMISAAAAAIITAASVAALSPVISFINELYEKTGADSGYINILYKSLGICWITELAAGICRDSGENVLASRAEAAGRVTLAVMSLPLFSDITKIIEELLSK